MTEGWSLRDELQQLMKPYIQGFTLQDLWVIPVGLMVSTAIAYGVFRLFRRIGSICENKGRSFTCRFFRQLSFPAAATCLFLGLILTFKASGWQAEEARFFYVGVTLKFLFWLALFWGVVRAFELIIVERILYQKHGIRLPRLFHDLILWIIYFILVFVLLKLHYDADLTVILTTSAVLSVILGLALQDTLANLFAGLALHFEGSLHLGQWIGVGQWEGEIAGITWRAIKIRTFEGDYVIIPNSTIAKSELMNYSQPTTLHVQRLPIGVSYEAPPTKVKEVCLEVVSRVEGILRKPTPVVMLQNYNDFSVDYEIRFWIRDYSRYRMLRDEVYSLLWYALKREGIVIPFPIRTLDLPSRKESRERADLQVQAEFLRNIDFLSILNDFQMEILRKNIQTQLFAAGETIIQQGQCGGTFYVVRQGEVEVSMAAAQEGRESVAKLGPGAFFGEHSLLTGEPASASVTALVDTKVVALGKDAFEQILKSNPNMGRRICEIISDRKADRLEAMSRWEAAELEKQAAVLSRPREEDADTIFQKMRRWLKF